MYVPLAFLLAHSFTLLTVSSLKNFRTHRLTMGLPFVSSLDYVAIIRVADLCSLILIFWHLIDAANANYRYCCSLGYVYSTLLFSWILRGLILSCCSFPFFIAFYYFCGRHCGRLKKILLFLAQCRNIQKRRSKHNFYWKFYCSSLSLCIYLFFLKICLENLIQF